MQMAVTGQSDAETDGRFAAGREDVMKGLCRNEYEIAGFRADRLFPAFDYPVDFTFQHDPPLVVIVTVVVIHLAGFLIDKCGGDMVGQHHLTGGRRGTEFAFDVFGTDMVQGGTQDGAVQRHSLPPDRGVASGNAVGMDGCVIDGYAQTRTIRDGDVPLVVYGEAFVGEFMKNWYKINHWYPMSSMIGLRFRISDDGAPVISQNKESKDQSC